ATTYGQSTSANATETITLSVNPNAQQTVLVGGTLTVGNQLKISVYDAALSGGGPETVSYTTITGDTPTTMATGLKNAINADTNLQNIGVTATSSGAVVTITSNSPNLTSYRNATAASVTETLVFGTPQNGTQTAVISGTLTVGNQLKINVTDAGLAGGGPETATYTTVTGDTPTLMATGLKS